MAEFSHDWQLFSLRACWKHCRAALHTEMKGSLKRTFTSARLAFFPNPALGTVYKWKWSKLKGFSWCISISQVCWDWYGRLKDSVNIESVPLEKVTAQPSDCRCRMPKLEGHWDNQEALWKDGLTLSSRRNNTSCRLRAQLCSYFWRITTPKGQNPTCPVCSVSSLLMRYIRKNLQRKDKQACFSSSCPRCWQRWAFEREHSSSAAEAKSHERDRFLWRTRIVRLQSVGHLNRHAERPHKQVTVKQRKHIKWSLF